MMPPAFHMVYRFALDHCATDLYPSPKLCIINPWLFMCHKLGWLSSDKTRTQNKANNRRPQPRFCYKARGKAIILLEMSFLPIIAQNSIGLFIYGICSWWHFSLVDLQLHCFVMLKCSPYKQNQRKEHTIMNNLRVHHKNWIKIDWYIINWKFKWETDI